MSTNQFHTTTRLEQRFAELRTAGRGGLVIFMTAGDPSPDAFDVILAGLPDAGADIIEIGMPFSDPMADGPAIQLANLRALDAGMTLAKTLDAVTRFRQKNQSTPIVLMGYYNPIYRYGSERFIDDAKRAGVDGMILVDLPPEEDAELCHPSLTAGIHWVRLVTPTTNDQRLPQVMANASGFVYYVSVAGITGTQSASQDSLDAAVSRLKANTELPIAVGFGIKTPQQVAEVTQVADAAVVGSAVVNVIERSVTESPSPDNEALAGRVHTFVQSLAAGVTTGKDKID